MTNHYETLGIDKSADARQIKRAYFELVKQFPPERFAEKFKEIRAAYDALSDEETRAKYDEATALPQDAAFLYNQAQMARHQGRHGAVTEILSIILETHPELSFIRAEYARSLEALGKTGKAIEVWEKLCARERDSAIYAVALADCYEMRGWRKKAIDAYKRAIAIDNGNVDCWESLIECHFSGSEFNEAAANSLLAVDILKKKGKESVYIYICAAIFTVRENATLAESYLKEIIRMTQTGRVDAKDIQGAITFLLISFHEAENIRFFPYINEMAATLPDIEENVRSMLLHAEREYEVAMLEEQGFDILFCDLFSELIAGCDCLNCRMTIVSMEYSILMEINTFRPQIVRLKNEYPKLYSLHSDFFAEVMCTRDPDKMLYRRVSMLSKHGFFSDSRSDDDDDDDEAPVQQTVRREGPKIGRNDPCPCGSGKKYKKCCGA